MSLRCTIGLLGAVFLACFSSAIAGQHAQSAKPTGDPRILSAKGEMALQNGDLEGAEKAFHQLLAIDPNAAGAYSNLGVIAMRRKDWDQALNDLQKAAKLAPRVSGVRLNIGLVYYRQGAYRAAISALSSVLRDQPDSEQARYLLGLCELFIQDYASAVATLEPLWKQKSNDFMYLYVLSSAASAAGQKDLSEKALTRLVEVGGDAPEFHLLLGKAYLNRQESEKEAIAELERAASMNPNLPFVHFNLGIAFARTGDNVRAEKEFRRDIAIEPDVPDTYELLGEFYMRGGKDKEAEISFHEALRRNPRMADPHFGIAKIYLRQRKYESALAAIDAALRFAPDSQGVHYLRGQILGKLGRKEEAKSEFARVEKIADSTYTNDLKSFREGRVPNPELTQ